MVCLVTVLAGVSQSIRPAKADTYITTYQPLLFEAKGVEGVLVVGKVRSTNPGPFSCPGADSSPDPDSVCSGMITRVAKYYPDLSDFLPSGFGKPPSAADHYGEAYAHCFEGLWRSEFSQWITNSRDSSLNRLDLRWGSDLNVRECIALTIPSGPIRSNERVTVTPDSARRYDSTPQ